MTARFDLEQKIMQCWSITEDLKTLYTAVCDTDIHKDCTADILLGMSKMYNLKFTELFSAFEKAIQARAV